MIHDQLENAERYYGEHPGFRAAFEFLRTRNLRELPLGRHEIDGERLFAIIARERGRGRTGAKPEAHRKYIDIQYVVAGEELIGIRATADCRESTAPFDLERDIGFFTDPPKEWVSLPPGTFAIFFPEDAHAPLAGEGDVHKAVVKIAANWQPRSLEFTPWPA